MNLPNVLHQLVPQSTGRIFFLLYLPLFPHHMKMLLLLLKLTMPLSLSILSPPPCSMRSAVKSITPKTETATYASQSRNRHIANCTAKNGNKPNLAHITYYMYGKKGHYHANCPQKSAKESYTATETPEVATMSAKVETEFSDKGW
jgi:hypothetical protein